MKRSQARRELIKDFLLICIGIALALFLSTSGMLDQMISLIGNTAAASFFAGIFFTSVFTLGPASVTLVNISEYGDPHTIALWGALGAVCGDLVLFFFIRDHFAEHITKSLRPSRVRRILASFHLGFMKWLSPILGALIIASPLPDEFGMALLGMSKIRVAVLIPIAFAMNMLGIYGLIWFTNVL
ncbi:MAG: hypothetical protein AAB381_01005 [Patescibacteria group bacterium]